MSKFIPQATLNITKILQKLQAIREKIGANPLNKYKSNIVIKEIIMNPLSREFSTVQELEDFLAVFETGHPFIGKDGKIYFLYIKDHGNYSLEPKSLEDLRRVHLTACNTIIKMEKNGRKDRYVGVTHTSGEFIIWENKSERKEKLHVCKNCLKSMKLNVSSAPTFDFKDFKDFVSKKYKVLFTKKTKYSETENIYDYPKNWKEIASRIRIERKYTCEECGNNGNEVHHKDGIKGNCSNKNLQLLCLPCHENQPNHAHYKTMNKARRNKKI